MRVIWVDSDDVGEIINILRHALDSRSHTFLKAVRKQSLVSGKERECESSWYLTSDAFLPATKALGGTVRRDLQARGAVGPCP